MASWKGAGRMPANRRQDVGAPAMQMEVAIKTKTFRDAAREQTSILAPLERAALRGLARRMPAWVNSDHLSVLGLLGMIAAGVCYTASKYNPLMLHLVNVFIFLNWFGDSLDGTLARYRNRQRPRYGFYVDHVIDCFGVTALLAGMGASGHMNPLIAVWMLVAYLLLSSEIFLATYALARFVMSYFYFGPTELRILLCIGNLYVFFHPFVHPFGLPLSLWDLGAVV